MIARVAIGQGPARARIEHVLGVIESGATVHDEASARAFLAQAAPEDLGFAREAVGLALGRVGCGELCERVAASPIEGAFFSLGRGIAWAIVEPSHPGTAAPSADGFFWDGYGFGQGLLRPGRVLDRRARPSTPPEFWPDADHGLGRSLWFSCAGRAARIAAVLGRFEASRWPDLWRGVGAASVYTGGVGEGELRSLVQRCPVPDALEAGAGTARDVLPTGS